MSKTFQRSHFRPHKRVQYTGEVVDLKTGELVKLPSMTKQEFKKECDINNIIKHFSVTGMFNHVNSRANQGAYQDLPDSVDFQESLNTIKAAETAFMSLPAKVRDRFGQDPGEFLAFMSDPANLEEIQKLGLTVPRPEAPPPLEVKVVNPEAPPEPPKA